MKITAFIGVNKTTDLAVSDDDQLLLVITNDSQVSITVIGPMTDHTFNGMRMALDGLEIFKSSFNKKV